VRQKLKRYGVFDELQRNLRLDLFTEIVICYQIVHLIPQSEVYGRFWDLEFVAQLLKDILDLQCGVDTSANGDPILRCDIIGRNETGRLRQSIAGG
jgi:hypothetical protein